jgi:hypothetical protein
MTTAVTRRRRRRGDAPPDTSRDMVVVLDPGTAGSEDLLAAARGTGGTVAVVIPLRIHGYAFGMPNPGLMPTARERAAAEQAIHATVAALRSAGVDVDGQIVVTRHAHRSIVRIVRRRGATRVLLEQDTASRLRRFLEGDLHRQLSRRLGASVTVATAAEAGSGPAPRK